MFKYCLKHADINNMHECIVHAQEVHHQCTCTGLTPVQSFLLDFVFFLCV